MPYFREEELGNRLGTILKDIYIPDEVLKQLCDSLLRDKERKELVRRQQDERLRQRLSSVRYRLDRAYQDKLDGKISEEFWARKSEEWQAKEQQIRSAIQALEPGKPERMRDAFSILELANKAYFLYLTQSAPEKAKLLKMVVSNCSIDATNLYPTYRKPFDLIFMRAKNEEWRARRDSNPRPSA